LRRAADTLEFEVWQRAMHGVDEPVIQEGKQAMDWVTPDGRPAPPEAPDAAAVPAVVTRYSDRLLMFLLKCAHPLKYGEGHR
jgi:hypothetical protein